MSQLILDGKNRPATYRGQSIYDYGVPVGKGDPDAFLAVIDDKQDDSQIEKVEGFLSGKNRFLLLTGLHGAGKTFYGSGILGLCFENGNPVMRVSLFSILDEYKKNNWVVPSVLKTVTVLFIDDFEPTALGKDLLPGIVQELLQHRVDSGRMTIVASAARADEIKNCYGNNIYSLLKTKFKMLNLGG